MVGGEHHGVRQDLNQLLMQEAHVARAEEADCLGAVLLNGQQLLHAACVSLRVSARRSHTHAHVKEVKSDVCGGRRLSRRVEAGSCGRARGSVGFTQTAHTTLSSLHSPLEVSTRTLNRIHPARDNAPA